MNNNLKNTNYYQIFYLDNYDNDCYICLEKINYYYFFDCKCHIYAHSNCIGNFNSNKCILCKNIINKFSDSNPNINLTENENFNDYSLLNMDIAINIIESIKLKNFIDCYFNNITPNYIYLLLLLHIIYSFYIICIIFIPLFTLNFVFNLFYYIIKKINFDYLFLVFLFGSIYLIIHNILISYPNT